MKLTREQALSYHRQMWGDMQRDLGDNPGAVERIRYKENWCAEHFPDEDIMCECFLCEYNDQYNSEFCDKCPIIWPNEKEVNRFACGGGNEENTFYLMPISRLLSLPEREDSDAPDDTIYEFKNRTNEMYVGNDCEACIFNERSWYEMPCEVCCLAHSAFIRKEDNNNERTQSISV